MALSTSTSTLAVGASRTFNLSPGSALTLVAPPNVRATITETPNTVDAFGRAGVALHADGRQQHQHAHVREHQRDNRVDGCNDRDLIPSPAGKETQ